MSEDQCPVCAELGHAGCVDAAIQRAERAERVAVWAVMHRARIELSVLQSGLDLVADFEYRVPCDGTKSGILAALAKAAGEE